MKYLVAALVLVALVLLVLWSQTPECFVSFLDVTPGTRVCPHGTNVDWSPDSRGACCQGGGCIAPGIYQTSAPRKGDWVCDTGVWGWGTKAGSCCDATGNNCVDPRQV